MRAQLMEADQAAAMNSGKAFKPSRPGKPICQACGGMMKKKTVSSGNFAGLVLALLVLLTGIIITVAIPVVGWVVGPLLILLSLGMGGKRQKVWRCRSCRSVVPRG
jgi:hypothetical protein